MFTRFILAIVTFFKSCSIYSTYLLVIVSNFHNKIINVRLGYFHLIFPSVLYGS